MLDVLRFITRVRIVPFILTSLLIAVGWTAMWPDGSVSPLLEIVLRWPVYAAGLYLVFLFVHPNFAHGVAAVLLSIALAGLAVVTRLPGTEVLSPLMAVHPAWYAAMLVQSAFWWSEGDDWTRWTTPTG
jgi:hypothetical protein